MMTTGAVEGAAGIDDTINSGQVFLWHAMQDDNGRRQWYGINGQEVLRIDVQSGRIKSCGPSGRWRRYSGDIFRVSDDMARITASMPRDRTMREAMGRYAGLRITRQDPYQCMISFIISANSNIRRITDNLRRITETFGSPVTAPGMARTMHLFPGPEVLESASMQEIRSCGVGYRAPYIKEASGMVASGAVNFDHIKKAGSYADARQMTLSIPGVGGKVADCIMLFSLERLDAFPLDRWMLRVLGRYYGGVLDIPQLGAGGARTPSHLTDAQYVAAHVKIVRYFGPYAGYAQQWLFKMARDGAGASWLADGRP